MAKRRGRTFTKAERPSWGNAWGVMEGHISTSTPTERVKSLVFLTRGVTKSHVAGDFMVARDVANREGGSATSIRDGSAIVGIRPLRRRRQGCRRRRRARD